MKNILVTSTLGFLFIISDEISKKLLEKTFLLFRCGLSIFLQKYLKLHEKCSPHDFFEGSGQHYTAVMSIKRCN